MKSPRAGIALLAVAWLVLVGWVSYEKSRYDARAHGSAKVKVSEHDPKDCECCREGHDHDHHGHDH